MRNKAIFASDTASKAGKGQRKGKGTEHTQREGAGAHHLHSVDTTTATTKEDESSTTKAPNPKYISLLPLLVSKIPDKTPKHTKEKFTFATFALIRCPFDLVSAGGVRKQKRMKACLIYSEHTKRATPPYLRSDKCPLPP